MRASTCVASWARTTPERPALVCDATEFHYAVLDAHVATVAAELRAVGVAPGDVVAIALPLGAEAVVALLGVLRAEAAFLPLDLTAPVARLEQLLDLASVRAVVGSASAPVLRGPTGCRHIDLADVVDLAAVPPPYTPGDDRPVDGTRSAYVLFTSGSTGIPKGIRVSHDNLDAYLRHVRRAYATDGHGATLATRLTFDLSITCLFLPLLRGELLRVVPDEPGLQALCRALREQPNLGMLKLTPSHLRLLNQSLPRRALADRVTTLVVGGEALYAEDLHRWRAESPGTTIVNEYGPTEATVGVAVHDATHEPASGPVPIGRPVEGVAITLAGEDDAEVPDGELGEIVVSGDQVASYLDPDTSTAFGERDGRPTYRTGDVALRRDGVLHYRGRRDDQVKVSGHRVELGEVETVVRRYPGIVDACALLVSSPAGIGAMAIVAVPSGAAPDAADLLAALRAELPAAAVPERVVWRAELPSTAQGKVDRAGLAAALAEAPAEIRAAARETDEMPADDTDVAVVGFDCVLPGAPDAAAFWSMLVAGRDGLTLLDDEQLIAAGADPTEIAREDYVRRVGIIDDIDLFDAEFFGVSPAEARLMDPQHRLLMHSTWRALQHAGRASLEDCRGTGLIAGVSANTYLYNHLLPHRDALHLGGAELQLLMASEKDFAPSRIAYALQLEGPAVAVQSGCSTGLSGVHFALQSLLAGDAETVVVGAACVRVPHHLGSRYREGSIVSPRGVCRAFDAEADGCVQGNGVVTVVLRLLGDAERDGDTVYAVIKGSAVGNDGRRKVGYAAPSVGGQFDVITAAQKVAGVRAVEIGYVEAHGTGTLLGDPVEAEALAQAFPDRSAGALRIGSLKTNLGHLDTAAGLAGLLKVVLALHHQQMPSSLNFATPNPRLPWRAGEFEVVTETTPWPVGLPYAGVSAFSVGGANAHVVLAPAPPAAERRVGAGEPVGVFLSAPTLEDLDTLARQLADHVEAAAHLDPADVAHTLLRGRDRYAHRGAWVARDRSELVRRLREERGDRAVMDATDPLAAAVRAAELWLAGGEPAYDPAPEGRRVALPPLPLHPVRHWAEVPTIATTLAPGAGLLAPAWQEEPLPAATSAAPGRWVVLARDDARGAALVAEATARGHQVVRARPGLRYRRAAPGDVVVGPELADLERLLAATGPVDAVVHAWHLGADDTDDTVTPDPTWSTMRLARAVARHRPTRPVHVLVATGGVADLAGAVPDPDLVTALGPVLVLPQEVAQVTATLVDVDPAATAAATARRVVREVEALAGGVVAHRGQRRYRRTLAPLDTGARPAAELPSSTWLVTGGFGGVGGEIAGALADAGSTLVLVERPHPPAPSVAEVEERLGAAYRRLLDVQDPLLLHDDAELVDRLTELTTADARWCLERLGFDPDDTSRWDPEEFATCLGVDPTLHRMVPFLMGCVRDAGGRPERATARARVVEWAPDLAPLLNFTARCVDAIPAVLTGERSAVEVLYPAGDPTDMETAGRITMARSSGSQQVHAIADWVAEQAAGRSRPLRVLEVGAGNGLLTDLVVAAVRRTGYPVEYWATDLGQTFVSRLAERHGGVPGFRAAILDASRPPGQQGLPNGVFDVVLGLNVVHATIDVEATAAALRTALAPGGHLALLESVRFEPWVDMIAGLAPGWWSFNDEHRTTSPLLDVAGWERVLERAGYDGVAVTPRDEKLRATADCALLVAAAPGADTEWETARARRVAALEARGARVVRVTADLADEAQVDAAVRTAVEAAGPVGGLVHCAAEFRGGMLAGVAEEDQIAELGAKAYGARHLLRALADQPLSHVVLSSSLTVHAGGEGQAAYVAANAALAALAAAYDTEECRAVAIDWGRWTGVGHAARIEAAYRTFGRGELPAGLSSEDALVALRLALASGLPQVAVPDGTTPQHPPAPVATATVEVTSVDEPTVEAQPPPADDGVATRLLALCQNLVSHEFTIDDRLSDAGVDSIVVLQLQAEIETELGVHVMTPALLGQTVAQLVRAIADPGGHPGSVRQLGEPVVPILRPGGER